jgi:hypothetical protein
MIQRGQRSFVNHGIAKGKHSRQNRGSDGYPHSRKTNENRDPLAQEAVTFDYWAQDQFNQWLCRCKQLQSGPKVGIHPSPKATESSEFQ